MEAESPTAGWNEPVMSVSQVNESVNGLLHDVYPAVIIEGEVSQLTKHRSGHWYFTLKDADAELSCVMWKRNTWRVSHSIEVGDLVHIKAELALYEQKGNFQAYATTIEPVGEGLLRKAFEELQAKLLARGWFDDSLKKPLPKFPKFIVVVTASEAAAKHDVYANMHRRYPIVRLELEPTPVQGQSAAPQIASALERVNQMEPRPDLAILTRGGGSLEDLHVFNSERVAEAIYSSEVPIVSAIGHESDFTIADLCADLRAPTPSTAVELVTPDAEELFQNLRGLGNDLIRRMEDQLYRCMQQVEDWRARMRNPSEQLADLDIRVSDLFSRQRVSIDLNLRLLEGKVENAQRLLITKHPSRQLDAANETLQERTRQLSQFIERKVEQMNARTQHIVQRLDLNHPSEKIDVLSNEVSQRASRVQRSFGLAVDRLQSRLSSVGKNLDAVSPLAVLDRGFAVVSKPDATKYGNIVRSISEVDVGEELHARLPDGVLKTQVTGVADESDE